jgi:hypothetical protein
MTWRSRGPSLEETSKTMTPAQITYLVGSQAQPRRAVHGGPHIIYEFLQVTIDVCDFCCLDFQNRVRECEQGVSPLPCQDVA